MNRKRQILGTPSAPAHSAGRSPLKPWGKGRAIGRKALACTALACSGFSLSGCGQKGPLYLPPPPVSAPSSAPASAPAHPSPSPPQ